MTETVRQKAAKELKLLEEITAVVLPEPTTALVPLAEADKPVAAEIRKRMREIEMENTGSIISFGSAAQSELQEISQAMLADVRNKDVGPAGDSLRQIVKRSAAFRSANWMCDASEVGGKNCWDERRRLANSSRGLRQFRGNWTRLPTIF